MINVTEQVLRLGPLIVLLTTCFWLMIATSRTSSMIDGKAYGFAGNSRQQVAQGLFRLSVIGDLGALIGYAAEIRWPILRPVGKLEWLHAVGLALALAGQFLTVSAQSSMGRRWRVGVPSAAPDALVTQGLFGVSRNPVFLGMLAMALGLALAVPSIAMIVCATAFWLACEIQVRDEERFLESAFTDQYVAYRSRVRRWF